MEPARTFRDLLVWREAHQFVLAIYGITGTFPKHELYSLTNQMRRAAVSVPANIAEGFKKRGTAEKLQFLNIAAGSLEESRYYLILAQDLGYGQTEPLMNALERVSRLLTAYTKAIRHSEF